MLSIPHRRTGKTEKAGDCSSTLFCPQGHQERVPWSACSDVTLAEIWKERPEVDPKGLEERKGSPGVRTWVAATEIYRELNQKVKTKPRLWVTLSLKAPHCGSTKPHGLSSLCYWGGAPSSSGTYTLPVDSPPDGRRALTWVPHWPSPTHTALCGLPFHSTLIANPQTLLWKNVNT